MIRKVIWLFIAALIALQFIRPTNDRVWNEDQSRLPEIIFEQNDEVVTIKNIRDFDYRTADTFVPHWYDRTFKIQKLQTVWLIVEPFPEVPGAAHVFLSFEFPKEQFVTVSIEIRKEVGEKFSGIKGLIRQYELMYVIASERDTIGLRANIRKDDVYLYPLKITEQKAQQLFVSMLKRTQELSGNPEFYNTITSNCTNNIIDHVNDITEDGVMISNWFLIPGMADTLAHSMGWIETERKLIEEVREDFKINELAEEYQYDTRFSAKIRRRK